MSFLLNLSENITFLKYRNREVGRKNVYVRNRLVLGSIETFFLEVDPYVSLKRATTGL